MPHWTEIVLGLTFLLTCFCAGIIARKIVNQIKGRRAVNTRRKMVEAAHCKGPHEYIKIYLKDLNRESNICKVCGWCSDKQDYYPASQIAMIATAREAQAKYEDWKEKQIEDISMELNIGFNDAEKLANRILAFKRDYQIHYINEKNNEK